MTRLQFPTKFEPWDPTPASDAEQEAARYIMAFPDLAMNGGGEYVDVYIMSVYGDVDWQVGVVGRSVFVCKHVIMFQHTQVSCVQYVCAASGIVCVCV